MEKAIAAISTPAAAGGIAMVRISGASAISVASAVFSARNRAKNPMNMEGYTAALGDFSADGEIFGEGICLVYRAPKSYTGEDVAELFCHGGIFIARKLLDAVLAAGAAPAGPGEFTRRAFENGKLNLSEAEAVMAAIAAEGEVVLRQASEAGRGRIKQEADGIKAICVSAAAEITAFLEYPEEDIPLPKTVRESIALAKERCGTLISSFERGAVYREGVRTVILGRPNAGKSSLMNALCGSRRSIVTPAEGTTRDVIEETVKLGDMILRLYDTAGIRRAVGAAEEIGVELALERLEEAALVIAVFDGSEPLCGEDFEVIRLCGGRRTICLLNKGDLPLVTKAAELEKYFDEVHIISAEKDAAGAVDRVTGAVQKMLCGGTPDGQVLFTARQRDCVARAATALENALCDIDAGMTLDAVAVTLQAAAEAIASLTGENVPDEIVDEVFSRFCIGK